MPSFEFEICPICHRSFTQTPHTQKVCCSHKCASALTNMRRKLYRDYKQVFDLLGIKVKGGQDGSTVFEISILSTALITNDEHVNAVSYIKLYALPNDDIFWESSDLRSLVCAAQVALTKNKHLAPKRDANIMDVVLEFKKLPLVNEFICENEIVDKHGFAIQYTFEPDYPF